MGRGRWLFCVTNSALMFVNAKALSVVHIYPIRDGTAVGANQDGKSKSWWLKSLLFNIAISGEGGSWETILFVYLQLKAYQEWCLETAHLPPWQEAAMPCSCPWERCGSNIRTAWAQWTELSHHLAHSCPLSPCITSLSGSAYTSGWCEASSVPYEAGPTLLAECMFLQHLS